MRSASCLFSLDAPENAELKLALMRAVKRRLVGATIEIRDGQRPEEPHLPPTGEILARLPLTTPPNWLDDPHATASLEGGQIERTGHAGWFRIVAQDGTIVGDATCGLEEEGTAEMTFDGGMQGDFNFKSTTVLVKNGLVEVEHARFTLDDFKDLYVA